MNDKGRARDVIGRMGHSENLPVLLPCDCRANDWTEGDNGTVRCEQCGGYSGKPGTSIRIVGAAAGEGAAE